MEELFAAVKESACRGIGPKLEGILIDAGDMDRIQQTVHHLRDIPYNECGVECTLTPMMNKGDFSFSIEKETAEAAIQQGRPVSQWLGYEESIEGSRLESFLIHWLDKESFLYYCTKAVFLEMDTSNKEKYRVPGVFVRLQHEKGNAKWYEMVTRAVLQSLAIVLTEQKRQFIESYFRRFSDISEYFLLGVMFSRDDSPLKLVGRYMNAPEAREAMKSFGCDILEYMEECDWEKIVEFSSGLINLSLDFTDKIEPRLGFEIESSEKDESVLDWLIEKGCCDSEKRQAVCNWPGTTSLCSSSNLRKDLTLQYKISHFKVVVRPDTPMQAKVYLECSMDSKYNCRY